MNPLEVTVFPGDVLYLPQEFWHATINCAESLSVAIQIRQQEPIWTVEHLAFASKMSRALSESLRQQKDRRRLARSEERMANALLNEAVRRSKNVSNPWLRLHHGHILDKRGKIAKSLRVIRRADNNCQHCPSCSFALAWAITRNARQTAVQFANLSAAVNKAKSKKERDAHMRRRAQTGNILLSMYREWGAVLGRAIGLDPESPSGQKEAAFVMSQQQKVVPRVFRQEFEGVMAGLPQLAKVAATSEAKLGERDGEL